MNDYQFMIGGIILLFTAAFLLFASSDGYMDRSYLYAWSLMPSVISFWGVVLAPGRLTPAFKFFLIFPPLLSTIGCSFLVWEDLLKRKN